MEIQFFTQKIDLTPEIRSYVIEKLNKIIKYAGYSTSDIRGIHIDVSRNPAHKDAEDLIRLEINIDFLTGQKVMQAVEQAANVQKAADLVEKDLRRQLRKMKEGKLVKKLRGGRAAKEMLSSAEELSEELSEEEEN